MESWLKRVRPVVEEKEKEIPIYLRVTKTIKLNVKESDSIGHVKALLHDKEGIPVCLQQLLSGDDKLADGRKLVDYGICENSTLHAYVEDSVPVITLYVKRSYAEGIVTVISKIYSTIHDMKYSILVKEGTDSGKFSLFHDGKLLEDGKTLAFLNIHDGSTLHMVRNPGDRYVIKVVMPDYQVEEIEVMATLSVRHVKTAIESKVGHSIGDKPLFMTKQKLEDEKQLYYYDIKEGSVLLVVEGTMQIYVVRRTDHVCAILDVHMNNSVKEMKELVLDKLGIPVHLQKLTFEGKGLLVDSRTLSRYKICNESILDLDVHNCSENPTCGTPQTGLLRDNTQPHRQMNSVTGASSSVMNHTDDAEDSRANTRDQCNLTLRTTSNRV